MFERYAVFFTPEPSDFAAFGAAWLGWDSAAGKTVPHPDVSGLDVEVLTSTPRKYGFHATLKAPFRLRDGATEAELIDHAERFACEQPCAASDGLKLVYQHGFLALRPEGNVTQLNMLAGQIVCGFELMRAPLREADIARRRRARLSARQDAQMLEWGYPFVFEDFHFHMTLSGRISGDMAEYVMPILQDRAQRVAPRPFVVDGITIMGEDSDGLFHQVHRVKLAG
ncbi:MAG: DUF1045 domain-containing protein [Arenibacterium sp.]